MNSPIWLFGRPDWRAEFDEETRRYNQVLDIKFDTKVARTMRWLIQQGGVVTTKEFREFYRSIEGKANLYQFNPYTGRMHWDEKTGYFNEGCRVSLDTRPGETFLVAKISTDGVVSDVALIGEDGVEFTESYPSNPGHTWGRWGRVGPLTIVEHLWDDRYLVIDHPIEIQGARKPKIVKHVIWNGPPAGEIADSLSAEEWTCANAALERRMLQTSDEYQEIESVYWQAVLAKRTL